VVVAVRPDFVFHLAAQSLVRQSYVQPAETFAINVQGTVHVLEALRRAGHRCAAVMVTTDKCYENREWVYGYREEDPLGGYDAYSASKGAAELAIAAYRRSFFGPGSPVAVASARAGNVLGGGDWAQDRIVPDCMRALAGGRTILVRNPHATRPWQHVLEPLGGYLVLGARLWDNLAGGEARRRDPRQALLEGAFNFGPPLESNRPVQAVVEEVLRHWPGQWQNTAPVTAPHEAGRLNLATDKAHQFLQWSPRWNFAKTIERTVHWYRQIHNGKAAPDELSRSQIADYEAAGDSAQNERTE
jgi:CDP-glucose 4,6-dehydratase